MGGCNIPNIFQENISKIFGVFDVVYAYIDSVIVITKHDLVDRLKDLENNLQKLAEAGLNVNAEIHTLDTQKLSISDYIFVSMS